jgi:hypothetical protein
LSFLLSSFTEADNVRFPPKADIAQFGGSRFHPASIRGSSLSGHWRGRWGRALARQLAASEFEDFRNMTKSLFIAAAAVVAFVGQAQAQTQAPAQPQANLRGNWLQADTTRQQAQQRAGMMFQKLDANHDGAVTRQEAEQAAAQMGGGEGGGKRFAGLIDRLFGQGDSVSQAQFEAQALSRFDRQDLNHDGVVTADERQQSRAARQQQGN